MLKTLPDRSVHCCVTSPPYYGLREYGTATWQGGDAGCDHVVGEIRTGLGMAALGERYSGGGHKASKPKPMLAKDTCPKCGAVRVDKQIGQEASPDEYVATMVDVFREIWRVLRDDSVCWLNLGDGYAATGKSGGGRQGERWADNGHVTSGPRGGKWSPAPAGYKPKDLMMIPARVALALQADGWWLRSDTIWHKLNPMPESCTDRPTSAHEHVFLLTKSETYFYDGDAIREAAVYPEGPHAPDKIKSPHSQGFTRKALAGPTYERHRAAIQGGQSLEAEPSGTRNARNVWTIATTPFPGGHFAVMPTKLADICIKAGTSEKGCCSACGAPWERIVSKGEADEAHRAACGGDTSGGYNGQSIKGHDAAGVQNASDVKRRILDGLRERQYHWQATCECPPAALVPCTVLDPFSGAGTSLLVADRLGRDAIGIDLNQAYGDMARGRLIKDAGLFVDLR